MKSLIPEIEIGKRYRIKIRPQEGVVCIHCGHEAGVQWAGREFVVTVLSRYQINRVFCRTCWQLIEVSKEGRYSCMFPDGTYWAIPYTDFLEEVE